MKRTYLAGVMVALLAAACSGSGAASLGAAPIASASPGTTGSPTPTPSGGLSPDPGTSPPATSSPGRTFTFEAWFIREGKLFVTKRTEPFTVAVGRLALDGLLSGPTSAEADAGVTTAIPPGTTLSITALTGGTATVDVQPAFGGLNSDLQTLWSEAQVVHSLTQYSTIERVRFGSGGPVKSRTSFESLLPPILVSSPLIGSRVSGPITISGTANVFEATVSVRILDADGNEIAHTFATASCGTGCRGDYSVSVDFDVDHQQAGTIEVFDNSAKDGSAENVQRIPVTLIP